MFDFSFTEMLLAGVVALVVLGPERLPKVARFAGEWIGKIQRLAAGVKTELLTHTEYADLVKIKTEVQHTAQEIREDLRDFEQKVHHESQEVSRKIQVNNHAWDNLPEQRTPADFGVDQHGFPIYSDEHLQRASVVDYYNDNIKSNNWQVKSLRKQAMTRKRNMQSRHRIMPKLRMRK